MVECLSFVQMPPTQAHLIRQTCKLTVTHHAVLKRLAVVALIANDIVSGMNMIACLSRSPRLLLPS